MNRTKRFWLLTFIIFLLISLSARAGASLVNYTFTGNTFDNYNPGDAHSHISIGFNIDDSLVPKNGRFELPNGPIMVQYDLPASVIPYFSISDGAAQIDSHFFLRTTKTLTSLTFDTDAEGNIHGSWGVNASSSTCSTYNCSEVSIGSNFNNTPYLNKDFSAAYSVGGPDGPNYLYQYQTANNPGTWTRTVIPIPGGLLLFVSALSVLCLKRNFSDW